MSKPMDLLKAAIRHRQLRRRFPESVIAASAVVDRGSDLGAYAVLFRDVSLLGSSLGAHSYVQSGTAIYNAAIGRFCSIAGGVTIGLAAHPTALLTTSPVFFDPEQPLPKFFTKVRRFTATLPRTTIGSDVWIGQGAMIKAGLTIGVGAVIGAGSVVTKDVDPYVVAAGNPCRTLRKRFSDELCAKLCASYWWDLDAATLESLAPLVADPEAFLAAMERIR